MAIDSAVFYSIFIFCIFILFSYSIFSPSQKDYKNNEETLMGYLMPKPSLLKNSSGYYLFFRSEDKMVHIFSKGISKKVNANKATGVWTHIIWGCSPAC